MTYFLNFGIFSISRDRLELEIELFLLGVTAEALRAKIDFIKSAISLQRNQFNPKFEIKGVAHTNYLTDCFQQRNFVADFLQAKCDFRRNTAVLRF